MEEGNLKMESRVQSQKGSKGEAARVERAAAAPKQLFKDCNCGREEARSSSLE